MRAHADYVIIDAPALSRSPAALAVAPLVDANLLVVSGDQRNVAGAQRLKAALGEVGGRCAGLIFNRAPAAPPKFLSQLLP